MHRLALAIVLALALGLGAGLFASASRTLAAPGCRAFGQGLIASEAQLADERPGVGEEAVEFAPANDDVAFFKSKLCG
jgi:hypothetical protein